MKLLQKKQQLPNRRNNSGAREGRATSEELHSRYAFRRNRTLTGSLASDVSSVNEHRSELRSPRVQAHHLRKHRRRLSLLFLGVIVIALGFAWVIYESIAGVNVAVSAPIPPISTTIYERAIQDYLNDHPFERNRLTLDTGRLVTYLQANGYPEIAGASIASAPASIGTSTITVAMRKPVVSWKTGASQLYVDSTGTAFQRNYYPSPAVSVIDQTGIQTVNNQVLASNRFLGFIGRIIGRLNVHGYVASKVVLPENTTRQLLVSIEGVKYPVKFSVDRPAGEQAEDADRAIRYLAKRHIKPSYLDLRVENRAYYK